MRRVLTTHLIQFSHSLPPVERTARSRFARLCQSHAHSAIAQTPLQWRRCASIGIPTQHELIDARSDSSESHAETGSWGIPLADEELTGNATSNDITTATKQQSETVGEVREDLSSGWEDIPIQEEASPKIADYRSKVEKARTEKELDQDLAWLEQKEREKILNAAKHLQQKKENMLMIRNFAIALLRKEGIEGVEKLKVQVTQLLHRMDDEDRHLEMLFEQMADLLAVSYPELMRQSQPKQVDKHAALQQAEKHLKALLKEDMG